MSGSLDLSGISSGLRRGEDGIWYGREQRVWYPPEGLATCSEIEDRSYWFQHRNDCIVAAVRAFPPSQRGPLVDVGGGNGFVSTALIAAGFDVVLVEPGIAGARKARARGVETVACSTLEAAEFAPGSASACGLFDVVEHISDDVGFLRIVHSLLAPGGCIYLTVPAYPLLWSKQDELAGHFRRYTRDSLTSSLLAAGFEPLFSSYLFRPLPLPIFFVRVLPHHLGLAGGTIKAEAVRREHAASRRGLVSRLLRRLMAPEALRIENREPILFGGSCLAVARSVAG